MTTTKKSITGLAQLRTALLRVVSAHKKRGYQGDESSKAFAEDLHGATLRDFDRRAGIERDATGVARTKDGKHVYTNAPPPPAPLSGPTASESFAALERNVRFAELALEHRKGFSASDVNAALDTAKRAADRLAALEPGQVETDRYCAAIDRWHAAARAYQIWRDKEARVEERRTKIIPFAEVQRRAVEKRRAAQ